MNLEKKYYNVYGNELNILQMVKHEPEWAANRIQEGEKNIKIELILKWLTELFPRDKWQFIDEAIDNLNTFFEENNVSYSIVADEYNKYIVVER